MKKLRLFPLVIGIVVSFVACDKDDDDDDNAVYNQQDKNFAMMAAMNNYAEIDAGQTASTKGLNTGIKEFGAMMVADHTTAGQQLKSITGGLGLYSPDSLDAKHVALKAQLAQLTGRAFDSVYIHAQVDDHQATIDLFEDEANDGKQQDLKSFANTKLPVLRMHLEHADSLANLYRR
jgi:putative membrane protein